MNWSFCRVTAAGTACSWPMTPMNLKISPWSRATWSSCWSKQRAAIGEFQIVLRGVFGRPAPKTKVQGANKAEITVLLCLALCWGSFTLCDTVNVLLLLLPTSVQCSAVVLLFWALIVAAHSPWQQRSNSFPVFYSLGFLLTLKFYSVFSQHFIVWFVNIWMCSRDWLWGASPPLIVVMAVRSFLWN